MRWKPLFNFALEQKITIRVFRCLSWWILGDIKCDNLCFYVKNYVQSNIKMFHWCHCWHKNMGCYIWHHLKHTLKHKFLIVNWSSLIVTILKCSSDAFRTCSLYIIICSLLFSISAIWKDYCFSVCAVFWLGVWPGDTCSLTSLGWWMRPLVFFLISAYPSIPYQFRLFIFFCQLVYKSEFSFAVASTLLSMFSVRPLIGECEPLTSD